MNMNTEQQRQVSQPAMKYQAENAKPSLSYRLFSTNWGLVLVGGLLAFAIGAATLHNGYVESRAQEVPEVEVEAVAEAEAFIPRSAS